jgi:hypothetical protein
LPDNSDDAAVADAAHSESQVPALAEELFCPECGYDLRGAASDRCPECGLRIDRATMSVSRIPWVHRREIGRFRAYWRTTRLVMFQRLRMIDEMNRPIRVSDARRFWMVTVLLAWLPIAAWAVGLALSNFEFNDFKAGTRLGWGLEGMIFLAALFAVWLFLLLATGSASYWFVSQTLQGPRQGRAIAISYYACAPLAWLWLPASMQLLTLGTPHVRLRGWMDQIQLLGTIGPEILVVVLFLWTGLGAIFLMQAVTHCDGSRTFAMCVGLPLSWALLLLATGMIPLAAALISMAILSFR